MDAASLLFADCECKPDVSRRCRTCTHACSPLPIDAAVKLQRAF